MDANKYNDPIYITHTMGVVVDGAPPIFGNTGG